MSLANANASSTYTTLHIILREHYL
jgi:hypothetical protein